MLHLSNYTCHHWPEQSLHDWHRISMDLQKLIPCLVLLIIASSASSSSKQDILSAAIGQIEKSIKDKFMTISYVNVVDDHSQPPPTIVMDIMNMIEAPKYTFSREEVTQDVRDHFATHESAGIAIWSPTNMTNKSNNDLKKKLWSLDQNISGFKRCVIVVIDEFGSFRKLFDLDKGTYDAPEKLHCLTVLIKPSK